MGYLYRQWLGPTMKLQKGNVLSCLSAYMFTRGPLVNKFEQILSHGNPYPQGIYPDIESPPPTSALHRGIYPHGYPSGQGLQTCSKQFPREPL